MVNTSTLCFLIGLGADNQDGGNQLWFLVPTFPRPPLPPDPAGVEQQLDPPFHMTTEPWKCDLFPDVLCEIHTEFQGTGVK